MLKLVLGGSGSGKTTLLYSRIRASGYGYRFNKKQAFSLHTICGILTVMH